MLNTNNNLRVADLPNNCAKKLAWMREGYSWHMIFTDRMSDTMPIYILKLNIFVLNVNFGANTHDQHFVPPTLNRATHNA